MVDNKRSNNDSSLRRKQAGNLVIAKELVRPLIIIALVLAASAALITTYRVVIFVHGQLHTLFAWNDDPLAYPSSMQTDIWDQDNYNNMDKVAVAVEAYLTANHKLPETTDDMGPYFLSGPVRCDVQHYKSKNDLKSNVPHLENGSVVYALIEKPRIYAVICGFPNEAPHIRYPHNGFETDELSTRRRDAALAKTAR